MKKKTLSLVAFSFLLLWTATAVAAPKQKEHTLKVGKRGEITLTKPTKVDGIVLQPDAYVIQHRVSGSEHFVRFVELKQVEAQPPADLPYTYTEADKAGEVNCRIEPVETVQETTAYVVTENGVPRITKVEIKGENVAHVF